MKLAAAAPLLLIALLAGCGGGGTTTVVEKTVTVETGGEGGGSEGEGGGSEGEAAVEEGGPRGGDDAGKSGADAGKSGADAGKSGDQGGQDEEKIEEPTAVVHLQSFRSPSGNIGCVMIEGGARCDIRRRDWSPPARPASCPEQVDFGQGLTVGHSGKASFVCAGDTTLDPSAAALAYGEVSELGGTQCISRSEGITCANHAGHGFFLSVQSYKLF